MKPETIAIHTGYNPEPTTKAVAVPIYQTTSYAVSYTHLDVYKRQVCYGTLRCG